MKQSELRKIKIGDASHSISLGGKTDFDEIKDLKGLKDYSETAATKEIENLKNRQK